MAGQAHHFLKYAPQKVEYGMHRFRSETARLYKVMDKQLARNEYLAGDYSIADIATLGWVRNLITFYEAREVVAFDRYANVAGWLDRALARPAVQRGLMIPARG
jgi:GST-like protein